MKLSDQKLRKAIHILVYGLPKTGKTELVGDLAEDGFNLFWFDFENGSKTLHSSLSQGAKERVEIYQIPDTKDFPVGIETALKVIKPGKHEICHVHGKVACPLCKKESKGFSIFDNLTLGEKDIVVFDSITQLSNSSMNNIGKGKDDDWKPEWTDYRNQGSHLDRFFSTIQNAPWHCVCITHEGSVEFDSAVEKVIPLAGTKNFSKNTAKYFDEIVYCEVRNKRHQAGSSTTFNLNILTGSRSRIAIEEQQKKDTSVKNSLLPIFVAQGISVNERAQAVLQEIKGNLPGAAK